MVLIVVKMNKKGRLGFALFLWDEADVIRR